MNSVLGGGVLPRWHSYILYDNDVFKLVREGVGGNIRKKGTYTKCVISLKM